MDGTGTDHNGLEEGELLDDVKPEPVEAYEEVSPTSTAIEGPEEEPNEPTDVAGLTQRVAELKAEVAKMGREYQMVHKMFTENDQEVNKLTLLLETKAAKFGAGSQQGGAGRLQGLQEKVTSLTSQLEQTKKRAENAFKERVDMSRARDEAREELDSVKRLMSEYLRDSEQLKKQVADLQRAIGNIELLKSGLQTQVDVYKKDAAMARDRTTKEKEQRQRTDADLVDLKQKMKETEEEKKEGERRFSKLSRQLNELQQQTDEERKRTDETARQNVGLSAHIATLEASNSSLKQRNAELTAYTTQLQQMLQQQPQLQPGPVPKRARHQSDHGSLQDRHVVQLLPIETNGEIVDPRLARSSSLQQQQQLLSSVDVPQLGWLQAEAQQLQQFQKERDARGHDYPLVQPMQQMYDRPPVQPMQQQQPLSPLSMVRGFLQKEKLQREVDARGHEQQVQHMYDRPPVQPMQQQQQSRQQHDHAPSLQQRPLTHAAAAAAAAPPADIYMGYRGLEQLPPGLQQDPILQLQHLQTTPTVQQPMSTVQQPTPTVQQRPPAKPVVDYFRPRAEHPSSPSPPRQLMDPAAAAAAAARLAALDRCLPPIDTSVTPEQRPHPTNLFAPIDIYDNHVGTDVFLIGRACHQMEAVLDEYGSEHYMKRCETNREIRVLFCRICSNKQLLHFEIYNHFMSDEHENRVRAVNGGVSVAALNHWIEFLKPPAPIAAKRTQRLQQQQDAERSHRLQQQNDAERAQRLLQQQGAERAQRLLQQQGAERAQRLLQQQGAERAQRLLQQQEAERAQRLQQQHQVNDVDIIVID